MVSLLETRWLLVGVLIVLGCLVGCGPNYSEGSEFQFTEDGNPVSFTGEEQIQDDLIGGVDGYGVDADAGAVRGRILLSWPANEVGTYAGDSISIERVTQVDFEETEFASHPFFNDECNSGATITITSVEYGLVTGEFSGNLCEDGIERTGRLNVEGTFAGSVADGYFD